MIVGFLPDFGGCWAKTRVKKKYVKTEFVRSALVITNMVGLSFNSSQFKSYWPKTDWINWLARIICIDTFAMSSQQSRSQIQTSFSAAKRPSSTWDPFGVVFARRASTCSSLPTLPGAASAVLALSSLYEICCFRFLVKNTPSLFPRIDTYQSHTCHARMGG